MCALPSERYHTVVIGAGPAGLACATILARSRQRVLLLERHQRVGPKVCAGGITHAGLTSRVPTHLIERSFPEQHIFSPWQKLVVSAPQPIISTVDRGKLGRWMLQEAKAAGVTVLTGVAAKAIRDRVVLTDRGSFEFRFLVGADGSSSLVRRHLGLPSQRLGFGIHYVLPGEFPRMEWHLSAALFRHGYAWIFPHGGQASVGVYACRGVLSPRRLLTRLQQWARRQGLDLQGRRPAAALVNYDYRGWRFDHVFLVGDAAGLASGLTGEGLYPAIVSGETAARAILDPHASTGQLDGLLRKLQRHDRVLRFLRSRACCRLGMEALLLALRWGWLRFNDLELGD